jgi:hypothetical protein
MSFGMLGSYVSFQSATKVAKAMNDKGFAEISMSFIPRFQNLARKLLKVTQRLSRLVTKRRFK